LEQQIFSEALRNVNVPLLVLDQKWHRLFALVGKPDEVEALEDEINEDLARQGKLNQELKELRKLKASLMKNIVENMDNGNGDEELQKKRSQDRRLIEEVNEKIAEGEEELAALPGKIREENRSLMLNTMTFCYDRIRLNYQEAAEIGDWIKAVRDQLKKNLIKKQNREINNKEIYAYMHDIFGRDVVNLFDFENQDVELTTGVDRPVGDPRLDEAPAPGKDAQKSDEDTPDMDADAESWIIASQKTSG
jgi:hypothetical protein